METEKIDSITYYYIKGTKEGSVTIQFFYEEDELITKEKFTVSFTDYEITNLADLLNLEDSDKSYKLTSDLDFLGAEVNPINGFTGTLNGNGYTIDNFIIKTDDDINIGLFGLLEGTIYELNLTNVSIADTSSLENVGLLAGKNEGIINNVNVSGSINTPTSDNVGGIVGYSVNMDIADSTNNATVIGNENVAGVIGYLKAIKNLNLSGNTNNSDIEGKLNVGGIIGYVYSITYSSYAGETLLSDNINNGNVLSLGSYVGGIVGRVNDSDAYIVKINYNNNENNGNITGEDYVGGIAGYSTRSNTIDNSLNTGNITGDTYVGGIIGLTWWGNISYSENQGAIEGKSYLGGIAGYTTSVSNSLNTGTITSLSSITEDGVLVANVGGIAGSAFQVFDCENQVDIEITTGGANVGGIAGSIATRNSLDLTGNTNLGNITSNGNNTGGIFGYIDATSSTNGSLVLEDTINSGIIVGKDYTGGIVGKMVKVTSGGQNITVTLLQNNAPVTGDDYVGGIFGYAQLLGTTSYVTNTSDIIGENYVGGYFGYSSYSTISNVTNNNIITGDAYVGGIVGYGSDISYAINNGEIISNSAIVDGSNLYGYIGGIAGYATTVSDSVNNVDINIIHYGSYVGGIVGQLNIRDNYNIENNINNGDITALGNSVGGIFGNIDSKDFSYSNGTAVIDDCENNGIITGANYTGGIIGRVYSADSYAVDISFTNMVNNTDVSGNSYVGGIIGYINSLEIITTSQNVGNVTGQDYIGGIIGYASNGKISLLTYDGDITGRSYLGGIAGRAFNVETNTFNGTISSTGALPDGEKLIACIGGIAGYAVIASENINNADITVSTNGLNVGGIVGYIYVFSYSDYEDNINNGNITSTSDNVGGIFGYMNTQYANDDTLISGNTNNGIVQGVNDVGGIVGQMHKAEGLSIINITFSNNTNIGDIIGTTKVGLFIGSENSANTMNIGTVNTNTGTMNGATSTTYVGYSY